MYVLSVCTVFFSPLFEVWEESRSIVVSNKFMIGVIGSLDGLKLDFLHLWQIPIQKRRLRTFDPLHSELLPHPFGFYPNAVVNMKQETNQAHQNHTPNYLQHNRQLHILTSLLLACCYPVRFSW